jgi:hypothetical protein
MEVGSHPCRIGRTIEAIAAEPMSLPQSARKALLDLSTDIGFN